MDLEEDLIHKSFYQEDGFSRKQKTIKFRSSKEAKIQKDFPCDMQQSDMRSFDIFEKHFCILTITVLRALLCHEDI